MNPLRFHAATRPEHRALSDRTGEWTYARLYTDARRCARTLAERFHIRQGDRVGILAASSASSVIAIHAVHLLRAVAAPLNTRLTAGELSTHCAALRPALVLTDELHPAVPSGLPSALLDVLPADEPMDESQLEEPAPETLHSVVFTSGTTGQPRPIRFTWRNHDASAQASAANLGVRDNDDWLCVLPLFHVGGLTILHRSARNGTAVTIRDGFNESEVSELLRSGRVTLLSVVPTMLHRLYLSDPSLDASAAASVRAMLLGGGPASPTLFETCRTRGIPVLGTFGMTETCAQVATVSPDDWRDALGTAGGPLAGVAIRMEDEHGTPVPEGTAGEICVRGEMVSADALLASWDPARADHSASGTDMWLRTGDIGRIDNAGRLVVLGRRDDTIITGGENVRPEEIESVLTECAEIVEAAVVGMPDEQWGQRVVAVLVPASAPFGPEELAHVQKHSRAHLAGYKIPREWHLVRELPRTPAGKLRRAAVRAYLDGLSKDQDQRTTPT